MSKPRLGTVLLTLWGILLTVAVYTYLAWLQPSRLGSTVSRVLESSLEVQCDIGAVSLSLFPLPSLTVDELRLRRNSVDHLEFHVRQAQAEMSWFSLLRFKPIIRSLALISPTLDVSGNLMQKVPTTSEEHREDSETAPLPSLPRYITGVRVHIENGMCRLASANGKDSLTFSGINAGARLPGIIPGNLELSIDDVRCILASGIDLSARETRLSVASLFKGLSDTWDGELHFSTAVQMGSLDSFMGRRISDPYRYFPMPVPLRTSLHATFTVQPEHRGLTAQGKSELTAVLPMNGHDVPISLNVPFTTLDSGQKISVKAADVRMGDDRLIINGQISGIHEGNPVLRGKAEISHFSLTRWFGFGRLMDPGLQKALDNITGAFEYFELTPYGVIVPRLTAVVEGIRLYGSGSCKEFRKPDIRIDAHARQADLNKVFTELHGEFPDLSHLPPPVLPFTPSIPSPAKDKSNVAVDYDIHISADDATIMNFRVGGADVHVIPAPGHGTMLTIDVADVYGGTADSKVYLQNDIRVVADLKQVALHGPSAALAGYPVLDGKLRRAQADIHFKGGSGVQMLTTLGGSLHAEMADGSISVKGGTPIPYTAFDIDARAEASSGKNATVMPPTVNFTGSWNVGLQSKDWAVEVDAPRSTLAFSTVYGLPCQVREQAMDILLTLGKDILPDMPAALPLRISGRTSFDAEKGTLALKRGIVTHDMFSLNGNVAFTDIFKDPKAAGRASVTTRDLKGALSLFGVDLPASSPSVFKTAQGEGAFKVSKTALSLTDVKGIVDDSILSGNLNWDWKKGTVLRGDAKIASLDFDAYLPPAETEILTSSEKAELPIAFLRDADVQAEIHVENFRAFSTDFAKVYLPVTQKNGTLTIPATALFPGGGHALVKLYADVPPGSDNVKLSLTSRANAVNMLELCKRRGHKSLIEGLANAQASVISTQRYWDDWRTTLNGTFSLLITNGAIISPARPSLEDGMGTESRTNFKVLSMSGAVDNGIVTCNDFRVMDTLLNVSGGGTVNLREQTIDAKATITVAGIPELPLTIKGNLSSPDTSYQLLGAVAGTVGNIGTTVFDVVRSVLAAPFKLMMGKRSLAPVQ